MKRYIVTDSKKVLVAVYDSLSQAERHASECCGGVYTIYGDNIPAECEALGVVIALASLYAMTVQGWALVHKLCPRGAWVYASLGSIRTEQFLAL
jgi:hypothetical protein